eukprot:TCONS_00007069-protein
MSAQDHLLKTLDLALTPTEAGAVNFSHLRTLLLGLINSTSHGPSNEENRVRKNSSTIKNVDEKDSGINLYKKDSLSKGSSKEQIDSLLASQKSLEDRINSLENDLNSYSNFASNEKILGKDEDESSSGDGRKERVNSLDSLGPSWQNLKTKKRLESAEEVIDKLFSLMNEVISTKGDGPASGANSQEGGLKNDLTDLAKTLDVENKKLGEKQDQFEQNVDRLTKDFKDLSEELAKLKTGVEMNKEGVTSNGAQCNENKKLGNENKSSIDKNVKDIADLRKKFSKLGQEKNTNDNTQIVETNVGASQSNVENIERLQKQIDELSNKLSEKSEQKDLTELDKKLSDHQEKTSNELESIQKEIAKLKEGMSNLDNAEMKELIDSMDDLKKMAREIEDLRKLSDLKDLADNVHSLKDIRSELDMLKNLQNDSNDNHKQHIEDLINKLKENSTNQHAFDDEIKNLKEALENLNASVKEIGEKQIDVMNSAIDNKKDEAFEENTDATIENKDLKNFEEELSNLKEAQQRLETMLQNLINTTKSRENETNDKNANSVPAFDTSVVAAIQHLAQQNRQQISALQAETNLLKKLQQNNNNTTHALSEPQVNGDTTQQNTMLETLHNHLITLQEEQVRLAGQLANMLDDTKDEFNRKQQHIDALYGYIEKLQNNKADKQDTDSSINVKADKQALDSKVNISTFDERYQLLEQALQNALQRLDQFVEKENTLSNALDKLHSDLDSKMDSEAEKKLKKFMEDRLKEIQKSRTTLHHHDDVTNEEDAIMLQLRNAAGLRKPMSLLYNCISCDRPVDISMRGVMGSVPHNFPAKKSMGPYTSYDLESLRNNKKSQQPQPQQPYERSNGRQCGGQHTTFNSTTLRNQKNQQQYSNEFVDAVERSSLEQQDFSVIDCVVGKDGQIYRGRFKPGPFTQPAPKRASLSNNRLNNNNKYKQRYTHSATIPSQHKEADLQSRDESRALSANGHVTEKIPVTPVQNGSPSPVSGLAREKQRTPSPLLNKSFTGSREKPREGSPIVLPPISRDGSLVNDEPTNGGGS